MAASGPSEVDGPQPARSRLTSALRASEAPREPRGRERARRDTRAAGRVSGSLVASRGVAVAKPACERCPPAPGGLRVRAVGKVREEQRHADDELRPGFARLSACCARQRRHDEHAGGNGADAERVIEERSAREPAEHDDRH
eukprot:1002947-Prymnesium_polylepis.1